MQKGASRREEEVKAEDGMLLSEEDAVRKI